MERGASQRQFPTDSNELSGANHLDLKREIPLHVMTGCQRLPRDAHLLPRSVLPNQNIMKTCNPIRRSSASRTLAGIIATVGLAVSAAFAAPIGQVGIFISGETFGTGKEIHVDSTPRLIVASTVYKYKLTGTIKGEPGTALADMITPGTPIGAFLESISKGSSSYLKGSFTNLGGTLPATILDRKISGSKKFPGFGTVKVTLHVVGKILADGKCTLDVTEVKFTTDPRRNLGRIKFLKGSKLLITAVPVVTFRKTNTLVVENAGTVSVPVRRFNKDGKASVKYKTVFGTAGAADFTPVSEGIVNFADGETVKNITIAITDNDVHNTVRRFTIEIFEPGFGAVLGDMTSTTVTITDNE
jgi:hypothetical protein